MTKKSYSIIVIAVAALLFVFFTAGLAQQLLPPTMFTTKIIEVDGVRVPDIGPLPTAVPVPATNLNYKAKVKLGEQLYFDGRLSQNGAISCAFCHTPGLGFADPKQVSVGVGGKRGGRQAPTVYNTAFNPVQFWDGRAGSLEEQAIGPIVNPVEMGETHENVVKKLSQIKGYVTQFQLVFGTGISMQGISEAIAAYERTIISTNSAFDQYVLGDKTAMNEEAQRGMALFKGKARCILCHNDSNFTDNQFHNLGVPQVGPMKEDLGRYYVTRRPEDKGAFKTPTLRSIVETAPYMHDGVFKTLEEVVDFFDQGGGKNSNLSPLMKPLGLTKEEKTNLIAFLKALKGEEIPFEFPTLPE
jgi:cytochrome c peroxidase